MNEAVSIGLKELEGLLFRVRALKAVLADRERELYMLKGPCRSTGCPLHYAHSGLCNIAAPTKAEENTRHD